MHVETATHKALAERDGHYPLVSRHQDWIHTDDTQIRQWQKEKMALLDHYWCVWKPHHVQVKMEICRLTWSQKCDMPVFLYNHLLYENEFFYLPNWLLYPANCFLNQHNWFFHLPNWYAHLPNWFLHFPKWFFELPNWFFPLRNWFPHLTNWVLHPPHWFYHPPNWFLALPDWFLHLTKWFLIDSSIVHLPTHPSTWFSCYLSHISPPCTKLMLLSTSLTPPPSQLIHPSTCSTPPSPPSNWSIPPSV